MNTPAKFACRPLPRYLPMLVSAAALLGMTTAHAAKYTATLLPNLPGGTSATAVGMNDSNEVVGNADDGSGGTSPVIWKGGTITNLDPNDPLGKTASAINGAGLVVGSGVDTGAFVIGPSASYESPYGLSVAYGINASGEVVGEYQGHPLVWRNPAAVGDIPSNFLGTPTGDFSAGAVATAVNAAGVIVGTSYSLSTDATHATRWSSLETTAKITDLGTLGGASSEADAINDRGWIVGWANLGNGRQHAALWLPTTAAYDLGTLGGHESVAEAINAQGDVAGSAQVPGGAWHAVVWTHKHFTAIDLNSEIAPNIAKTVTLVDAVATNDHCSVVATGVTHKGIAVSYLLTLTNRTACN